MGDNFGDCSAIDIGCICANDDLLSDLACKVTESCSSEEIESKSLMVSYPSLILGPFLSFTLVLLN